MAEESTTPDLAEQTRRAIEVASRHDLDGYMSLLSPDAVFDLSDVGMGTFEGHAAIRDFFEGWWDTWGDHLVDVEETVDLGNGIVFARVWERGRIAGGDGYVEQRRGFVSVWVQGMITRTAAYLDIDEARAAAERLAEERG
jgi:ketosteroid isomerase-like protein